MQQADVEVEICAKQTGTERCLAGDSERLLIILRLTVSHEHPLNAVPRKVQPPSSLPPGGCMPNLFQEVLPAF